MKKVKIYWIKILSVFCVICICFLTVASCFAMAASGSPTSWDDVGEDVIALRDSYFEYFVNATSGDAFGAFQSASEIPVSWLKTVNDLGWCISPADNIYYYLKDGALAIRSSGGGGRVRSGVHGGGGYCRNCKKSASECTCDNFDGSADDFMPFVSGKYIKDVAADYNSRYMPMTNPNSFIWSYNCGNSLIQPKDKSYYFAPSAPIYTSSKIWGNSGWLECYILPFIVDDGRSNGKTFYGVYYFHFYAKRTDDGSSLFCADVYKLQDNSLVASYTAPWQSGSNGTFYGLFFSSGSNGKLEVQLFGSSFDYWNDTDPENSDFLSDFSDTSKNDYAWVKSIDLSSSFHFLFIRDSSSFTPYNNKEDDWGYMLSNEPFELFANQTHIDYDKIPDNYVITINGDTIYDYSVTNPDSGDSTTINKYITNNYVIPDGDKKDDDSGSSSGGSMSGNVTVGGKVDVSGDITIKSDPININVNVNSGSFSGGSSGTGEAVRFDQDIGLNNYYNWMQEQTTGFSGFMKNFFGWLPGDIVIMLCAGFALVILARFLGR